ncbi:hypothetical protein Tco_0837364 [Tanacetum coccineum]
MDTEKPLLKDSDGDDVDVHLYRSMIRSLMYLTSSRPDIMYLKSQPKLGLWYPRNSPFDLVAYSDSDYARASLDRKSTIGGTLENRDMEITTTIDGKVKIVSEASIRRHLKLEDSNGISDLPTTKIFEQLALMGSKKTAWEKFSSNIATSIICLATNRTFNFSKLIFDGMVKNLEIESHYTPTVAPSTSQPHHSPTLKDFIRQETEVPQPSSPTQTHVADEVASTGVDNRHGGAVTTVSGLKAGQGSGNIHKTPTMPHDSPLLRVHTLGSDKGRMQPNELMELVTKLSDRVAVLENDLKQTKRVYGATFTKLIKKVKTLEKTVKSRKARRKTKLVVSDNEEEYSINQGRKIAKINEDPNISLVYTAEPYISTANVPVSTDGAEVSTAAESLAYIRRSAANRKDKGKAIGEESKPIQTKTKIQQEQERLGFKVDQRLQEQFDEEERQRIASVHEEASTFKPEEWDNIQAQIEADEELANRRNRPLTQAQQRSYMRNYIKHIGSDTLQQFRGYSFDEIKVLFEVTVKRVNTFTLMESDDTVPKVVAESSKRSTEEEHAKRIDLELGSAYQISPTTEDDECYEIDDLDEMVNEEAQELLANKEPNSFLSRGLEKSIDQSDLECCKSTSSNEKNGVDSENLIWRIDSANMSYPVT